MRIIASRWLLAVVLAGGMPTLNAPGQLAPPPTINGVYNGTYAGDKGPIKFKLTLTHQGNQKENGPLNGAFTLYLADGSSTKEYTCEVSGLYIPANRSFFVLRGKWETPPPNRVDMPGMNGVFDPAGGNGAGHISGKMRARPASEFQAIRDADESAKMARPTTINGVYTGEFKHANDSMKLKFSIKATDDGSLTGVFTFELPRKPGSFITYKLSGRYDAGAHDQWGNRLDPFQFTTIEPVGSAAQDVLGASEAQAMHVGITGPGAINGSLTGSGEFNGGSISATKDRTPSADLDKVMAAQASAGSSAAPAAAVIRSSFDGVYNGTITGKEGPTKFKLTLWTQREIRGTGGELVSTDIAGLLTFNLPEGSDTKAYTCELATLQYPNQDFDLAIKRWDAPPPRNIVGLGLACKFDPDGGHGVGQISGHVHDPSYSQFQAIRDAAESANMPNMRIANNIRPGIQGVFNGTYTREKGPPTKFKLTIFRKAERPDPFGGPRTRRSEQIIKGLATIYLPVGSGTKACTYDLEGVETRDGEFQLQVHEWVTIPPKGFENFRSMGFAGTLVLDLTKNTARIVSLPPNSPMRVTQGSHSWAIEYLPQFEAMWDATESVDFRGAMAAQKAVGAADWDAALKVHYDTMKNAPPKQLASKDLVRKSWAYWEDYQKDMLREVFDGGFGSDIDDDLLFEELFCTYVDNFSAKCRANLPAKHETVVVTRYHTHRDGNGGYSTVPEQSWTVEVDSRLAPKYRQFANALGSPSALQGLGGALGAMSSGLSPRDLVNEMLAPARDMERFFATETGRSAAMCQLTENFLRGATGEPSLQQADGKIDGAAAETDKDLPPGRFARFVDGANAFYRDPANAKSKGRNDTAFCQGLAVRYQFKMDRDDHYYYANDFKARFYDQIMQQHWENCTDPEWPILHPVVEECIAKTQ